MGNPKKAIDELYQGYLAKVYQDVESYGSYHPDEHQAFIQSGVSFTYGEMLYPSVKKILTKLKLSNKDIFLDLGSGLGKFALQVFMQSAVGKVIGIEALPKLSEQAQKVVIGVQEEFPFFWEDNRELTIITGNFLTQSWQNANVVYMCSTCFRPELLNAIGERVNQIQSVQHVLTLRPLPTLERLKLKEVFTVECSWDSALCYHYSI